MGSQLLTSLPIARLRRLALPALALSALAALAVATASADGAVQRSTLLPPKSTLSVKGGGEDGGGEGGGGEDGGGEGGGRTSVGSTSLGSLSSGGSLASATLPPPAAWVVRLQTKLATLGYFTGPRTGVYGPLTTAAVKRFPGPMPPCLSVLRPSASPISSRWSSSSTAHPPA